MCEALRDSGFRAAEARTAEDACIAAARPSRLLQRMSLSPCSSVRDGGTRARLAAIWGGELGQVYSPFEIEFAARKPAWPLAEVLQSERMTLVEPLMSCFHRSRPAPGTIRRDRRPSSRSARPRWMNSQDFLSPASARESTYDERYQDFLVLVATQIATAIANARSYEEERRRAEALAEIDRAKTASSPTSATNFARRSRSCWGRWRTR